MTKPLSRAQQLAAAMLYNDLNRIKEYRDTQYRILRLTEALKPFAGIPLSPDDYPNTGETRDMIMAVDMTIQPSHVRAARRALK